MTSPHPVEPAGGCPVDPTAIDAEVAVGSCPASDRAAGFDPFGDAYNQDPPEYLRWARDQAPIFWSPQLGYWVVARYDDIKAIFRDHLAFSPAIALEKITPTGPEANAVLASYGFALNRTLVNEDEPAHMPRRRLLMPPFTPEHLQQHEPLVRELTRRYVDRFVDAGRADLVDQLLWEVPLTVALHFLGVPEEDMDTLRRYSIAHTVNTWGRPKPEEQVAVAHAVGHFWQYAGEVLEKMRRDPSGPGWMQFGIRLQQDHPEVVTDSYLHSMMMAGIVAAHETTANATANAVKLLLQHPDIWAEVCADPGLIPNTVEECLRHNGSVAAWRRIATRPVEVGGTALPAGAKLLIVVSSANHDERHFGDADRVDVRRDNASDHLTFGYGAHQCMGKNLARMEMQVFLEELTRRLPHMRLAEQRFSYVPNTSFRGPEHLWVEWDPARNPERADPALLRQTTPVRLGEASAHAVSRPVVVERVAPVADGVLHLRLVAPDGRAFPAWSAGSHIDVELGEERDGPERVGEVLDGPERVGEVLDGQDGVGLIRGGDAGRSRQYSLCGDPADFRALEIAVLREADGRGGSAWLNAHARPGLALRIRGPRNHFRFDEGAPRAVFVAGGIGITPVMAMARRAQAIGIDYALHYAGRSKSTMAFVDALAARHGDRVYVHAADAGARLDLGALFAEPEPGTRIYACGPQRLLEAIERATAHWPDDALRTEHFHAGTALLDPSRERPFEVELKDSGVVVRVRADQTLLAALRAANVDVPSDCEEGLCGTCELRVLAGAVDHRDVVLTRAERAAGDRMMSCCSRAQGARLVLDL